MPSISSSDAAKVLARLDSIRAGAQAQMESHFYPIGSHQPETNIGSLNTAYNAGMRALIDTEVDAVSGTYDVARWMDLAATTEASMRNIDSYTEGVSVAEEVSFVAVESAKELPDAAPRIIGSTIKTMLAGLVKGLGSYTTIIIAVVILLVLGVLYLMYMPHRRVSSASGD